MSVPKVFTLLKIPKTPPKTVKHFWVKNKYNLYCTSWLVNGHFISNTTFAVNMRQLLWHGCRAGGRKHFTQAFKQALQSHCCDTARTMPLRLMCLSTSGKGISQKVVSNNTTTITTSDGILSKLFGNSRNDIWFIANSTTSLTIRYISLLHSNILLVFSGGLFSRVKKIKILY